jgi:hypothetical protein
MVCLFPMAAGRDSAEPVPPDYWMAMLIPRVVSIPAKNRC